MKEKDFQSLFSAWVDQNKQKIRGLFGDAVAFELKISKGPSIRFDAVSDHQRVALLEVTDEGCYHKINDMPFIKDNPMYRFTNKKPFDCFFISNSSAYIVVFFYKKGQRSKDREMFFINIKKWIFLSGGSKKSVSEELLRGYSHVEKLIINK